MAINDKNTEKLEIALTDLRIAISSTENPPIELLYKAQIIPLIAEFLKKEHFEYVKVQTEAAWIIANVLSGDSIYTEYVVKELNGIELMLTLLHSPSQGVQEMVRNQKFLWLDTVYAI